MYVTILPKKMIFGPYNFCGTFHNYHLIILRVVEHGGQQIGDSLLNAHWQV